MLVRVVALCGDGEMSQSTYKRRLLKFSKALYLSVLCCPVRQAWQEPAVRKVRWYDCFFMLVPIVGVLIFTETIRERTA